MKIVTQEDYERAVEKCELYEAQKAFFKGFSIENCVKTLNAYNWFLVKSPPDDPSRWANLDGLEISFSTLGTTESYDEILHFLWKETEGKVPAIEIMMSLKGQLEKPKRKGLVYYIDYIFSRVKKG